MALSKAETFINFTTWSLAVFYSVYNFQFACKIFEHQEDTYNDFAPGWPMLERRKDAADEEWQTILQLVALMTSWCFVHSITSKFILKFASSTRFIYHFHLFTSITFLLLHIHPTIILILFLQPLAFRAFYAFRNKGMIWLCALLCLVGNTLFKFHASDLIQGCNERDLLLSITCMFWMNLRCLSCCIDKINKCKETTSWTNREVEYFAYCFYLPLLFYGPFISFDNYKDTAQNGKIQWGNLGVNLARVLFWIVFTEFALHYIYVNPMAYQVEHVKTFDSWTIYGYGYAMGQFFHLKYVVLYGFSCAFAEFEGIEVPNRPKCIGRIHVYSDMWKHFDPGFYNFLLKYVYIPIVGLNQVIASIACFSFVYIWHGIEVHILIWTAINLACVMVEKCFQLLLNNNTMKPSIIKLSASWHIRLHGILAAPLLAISAMSNAYFFAGFDIGNVFFTNFFQSTPGAKLTLFFLLYFCCQVSIATKQREQLQQLEQQQAMTKDKGKSHLT